MATVSVSQYIDVDVDIELEDIDKDEMVDYLRESGYSIQGGPPEQDPDVRSFEYLIWQALRNGDLAGLRSLCAEMVGERIGRFA